MAKAIPWAIDASTADRDTEASHHVQLIRNRALDNFLNFDSDCCILVAAKGQGKTLALLQKASEYRERQIPCIPARGALIERMPTFFFDVTNQRLMVQLREKATWAVVWEYAIAAAVADMLRARGEPAPTFDAAPNAQGSNVSVYASALLSHEAALAKAQQAMPQVRQFFAEVRTMIGVFIDNIDEAIEQGASEDSFKDKSSPRSLLEVWVNAQLGLVDAIDQIRKVNKRLRISATIRIEAYKQYNSARAGNLQQYCQELTYSEDDLLEIFKQNVLAEAPVRLAVSGDSNMIIRLFGRTEIEHDRVTQGGETTRESIFSCLVRHTLGRPRDLMRICAYVVAELPPSRRATDDLALREAIRSGADKVYDAYKKECLPTWDASYELFLEYFPSNIVSDRQIARMANAFGERIQEKRHPACYFHGHGLLGTVLDGKVFFVSPNANQTVDGRFPAEQYFFAHPCMSNALTKARMHSEVCKSVFSPQIIVGRGFKLNPLRSLTRLRYGHGADGFRFWVDEIEVSLPDGNSDSRLLFAVLVRAVCFRRKFLLDLYDDVLPEAATLSKELSQRILGVDGISPVEESRLALMFEKSKLNSGVAALKVLCKALNDYPLCCNKGAFVMELGGGGKAVGPIIQYRKDKRKVVEFALCGPDEILKMPDGAVDGLSRWRRVEHRS